MLLVYSIIFYSLLLRVESVLDCIDYWNTHISNFTSDSAFYLPCPTDTPSIDGVDGEELLLTIASKVVCEQSDDEYEVINSSQKYYRGSDTQHALLKYCAEQSEDDDRLVLYEIKYEMGNPISILSLTRSFRREKLPKLPVFKQLPHINLKLSSDFFYPFSCSSGYSLSYSKLFLLLMRFCVPKTIATYRGGGMGGQPTKLRKICQKVIMPRSQRRSYYRRGYHKIDPDIEYEFSTDRTKNVPPDRQILIEMDTNDYSESNRTVNEIQQMKLAFEEKLTVIRHTLDELEQDHNRKLDHCANASYHLCRPKHEIPSIRGNPKLEECRLRNALIQEKLNHCKEYLKNYDALMKQEKKEFGENPDTFVRKLLFKTAKKQLRKDQLSDAIDTFHQLIKATNGQLCAEEMWVVFEVCNQKCDQLFEFYERMSHAVKTPECENSEYIMKDLWMAMVEDLRLECSEMFDLVLKVTVEVAEPLNESCLVEKLKYLLAAKVSAQWLEMTSIDHIEYDDIKDMFFDSLNKCIDAYLALRSPDQDSAKATKALNHCIKQFHTRYTTIAGSKKLMRAMDKVSIFSKLDCLSLL
ncbi:unnamed protein product [Bursaphelenchus okinawaensis]|uniref:Uncharacterized protein n=1 Tax=Bursaphelenchus okinawaensis TaxID=465554 RepID=A0A811KWF9_9BILA|nr:unnamed protein product [Bursaphelenchus okinawaensis]CAG9112875.1 unnamed protein product [Bursaphelenchus okinawaensis]